MRAGWPMRQGAGIVSRCQGKTLSLGRDVDDPREFVVVLSERAAGRLERHDGLSALQAIHEFARLYRAHIAPQAAP